MKSAKSLLLLVLVCFCFAGCKFAHELDQPGDKAIVNVRINDISNARTVFPDVSVDDITDIVLLYEKKDPDGSPDSVHQKKWDKVSDISSFEMEEEIYNFSLSAKYSGFNYFAVINNFEIKGGTNTLTFHLSLASVSEEEMTGKGTLNFSLSFPSMNITSVKAGLFKYNADNELVSANELSTLEITAGADEKKSASYSVQNAAGVYVLKYFFYEEETLVDVYSTVVYILNGVVSSASESIDYLHNVFSILYELNGGAWAEGFKAPGQYSYLNEITLPDAASVSKPGYLFIKWSFTNSNDGEKVTEIDALTGKDVKVYAIWKQIAYADISIDISHEDIAVVSKVLKDEGKIVLTADEGYDSYAWTVNEVTQSESTNVLTINYNKTEVYNVFLLAGKTGIKYSTTLSLNVITTGGDDTIIDTDPDDGDDDYDESTAIIKNISDSDFNGIKIRIEDENIPAKTANRQILINDKCTSSNGDHALDNEWGFPYVTPGNSYSISVYYFDADWKYLTNYDTVITATSGKGELQVLTEPVMRINENFERVFDAYPVFKVDGLTIDGSKNATPDKKFETVISDADKNYVTAAMLGDSNDWNNEGLSLAEPFKLLNYLGKREKLIPHTIYLSLLFHYKDEYFTDYGSYVFLLLDNSCSADVNVDIGNSFNAADAEYPYTFPSVYSGNDASYNFNEYWRVSFYHNILESVLTVNSVSNSAITFTLNDNISADLDSSTPFIQIVTGSLNYKKDTNYKISYTISGPDSLSDTDMNVCLWVNHWQGNKMSAYSTEGVSHTFVSEIIDDTADGGLLFFPTEKGQYTISNVNITEMEPEFKDADFLGNWTFVQEDRIQYLQIKDNGTMVWETDLIDEAGKVYKKNTSTCTYKKADDGTDDIVVSTEEGSFTGRYNKTKDVLEVDMNWYIPETGSYQPVTIEYVRY